MSSEAAVEPPQDGIEVAAVDDHPTILYGVTAALRELAPDLCLVCVARGVDELLAELDHPVIVLLDLNLNDTSLAEDNVAVLVEAGHRVLIYSQERRPGAIARALRPGAAGFVGKDVEMTELADAIRTVARGEPYFSAEWAEAILSEGSVLPDLSARERQTMQMYAGGSPVKHVARQLDITEHTVREHLNRAKDKYEAVGRPARTKVELYIRAVEDGLLPPPGSD